MPWPNQAFFYAIVALDEQGNRSPVSNLIAVYIAEVTTTTTTMSPLAAYPDISPAELLSYLQRQHNHQLDGRPTPCFENSCYSVASRKILSI